MISETQHLLLQITGSHLFQKQRENTGSVDWYSLLEEAKSQAVLPIVFSETEADMPEKVLSDFRALYYAHLGTTVRNAHQHGKLHTILTDNHIPYVIIKGMASASYYPRPFSRSAGDVDFLVPEEKLQEAKNLLIKEGYKTGESSHHAHLTFLKDDEILEMHWEPNGMPQGEKGELCRRYFSDIFETATLYEAENEKFLIPDDFHHGLVLLLHTAKHMINTGIGLKHLCDWAVFAGKPDERTFRAVFEEKLKAAGLWRFAQILTQLSTEYLGCPEKAWAAEDTDRELLESMAEDIFASGNFGKKDIERINEAKLITSGRSGGTVDKSASVFFKALSEKAYIVFPPCKKAKILLPVGWLAACVRHLLLILRKKRPKLHFGKMVSGAKTRREIYLKLHLFE